MNYNQSQNRFNFPILLTPDEIDGGYVVTFPDLPEAITQGDTIEECLTEAKDCLEESIALRIDDNLDIPYPSLINNYSVSLSLTMELKAILYLTIKESGLSYEELAKKVELETREIIETIKPNHQTSLAIFERILTHLNKRLEFSLVGGAIDLI